MGLTSCRSHEHYAPPTSPNVPSTSIGSHVTHGVVSNYRKTDDVVLYGPWRHTIQSQTVLRFQESCESELCWNVNKKCFANRMKMSLQLQSIRRQRKEIILEPPVLSSLDCR